ncbi:MAG TPA: family 16 glycoside hydrolase [Burkholderiales bacterium]|jgi:hypothetical protein|nr:family 16 glycoside hydrolase [Burkholderiales bacterium]
MALLTVLATSAASAETDSFSGVTAGALPAGWVCGVTGKGSPKWAVEADGSRNVLRQSGSGTFPWCVKNEVSITDGFVEVRFRPEKGREDQAGGIVWRWQDGDNYYVARANALENNVSLYYTAKGRRNTLEYVDAPVPGNVWHTLRVEFAGKRIKVLLDGKPCIEMDDEHFPKPGAIGVWTKADSVTAFSEFSYGALK